MRQYGSGEEEFELDTAEELET